jgi:hypothetical protein
MRTRLRAHMNHRASKLAAHCHGREGARPDSWGPSRPGTRRPSRPETRSPSTVSAGGLADGSRRRGAVPPARPCPGTARAGRRDTECCPHSAQAGLYRTTRRCPAGRFDAETGHRTTEHSPTRSCRTVRNGGLADGSRRPVARIPDVTTARRAGRPPARGRATGPSHRPPAFWGTERPESRLYSPHLRHVDGSDEIVIGRT